MALDIPFLMINSSTSDSFAFPHCMIVYEQVVFVKQVRKVGMFLYHRMYVYMSTYTGYVVCGEIIATVLNIRVLFGN